MAINGDMQQFRKALIASKKMSKDFLLIVTLKAWNYTILLLQHRIRIFVSFNKAQLTLRKIFD